jgi:hypothetical protein
VGKRHVYDIEVRNHHNFVANDVVVHNCTGQGAQRLFVKGKPKSIIDIATLTSIYRPGPLAAKVDRLYLEAKNDGKELEWGDHRVNDILKKTYSCLTGDTHILTEQGEVPIRQIVEQGMVGTKLPSYNEMTKTVEMDEVVAVASNGVRDIIEVELEGGETLSLTEDHLVMTPRGWVQAGELTSEDEILGMKY